MSLKPPKASDLEKDWMKKRNGKPKRIFPEYHLIVCEGTKTEPNYFQELSNRINEKYKGRISLIIKGKGKGTLDLLEEAIEEYKNSNKEIKHVWIIYDKDEFPKDSFDNTYYKCETMKKEKQINEKDLEEAEYENSTGVKFHAIYSNECIELWFLLHFKYVNVAHNRKEYVSMLSEEMKTKGLGEYAKNDAKTCEKLLPYLDTAMDNAERLNDTNVETDSPWKRNPSTKVYELMNILKNYL